MRIQNGIAGRAGIIEFISSIAIIAIIVLIVVIGSFVVICIFLTTFGRTSALQSLRRLTIWEPAMRAGWLAYITKTYPKDAVSAGPALGEGELVVADEDA